MPRWSAYVATTIAACGERLGGRQPAADTTAAPAAATDTAAAPAATSAAAETIKLGFITKFPVDFFFTLENAAKTWDETHPDVEIVFGQGKTRDGRRGRDRADPVDDLAGREGHRDHAHEPAVIPALDKAVEAGVKVVLLDNDMPDWTKQVVGRRDRQPQRRRAGRRVPVATNLKPGDTIAVLEGVPGVPALDDG